MSKLVLVRHGQASFFSDDYDRLSEIGHRQSRVLGDYWAANGETFDEVYHGSLTRQIETAAGCGEAFADAGLAWPEAQTLPGLNEYDSEGMMNNLLPVLAQSEPAIAKLRAAFEASTDRTDRYRSFHHLLEAVAARWVEGDVTTGGFETFAEFDARVRDALKSILSQPGGGRSVAVFTSGGPIGVCVQSVLRAPPIAALELNWRVHNASLTQFTFSKARVSLDSFNGIAHLTDRSLWTYR